MKINILQPFIPHYREGFFKGLSKELDLSLHCYDEEQASKGSFNVSGVATKKIKSIKLGPFLVYNPFQLIKDCELIIVELNKGHLTTWLLLLTQFLHKRKIIVWGHGISVKRYLKEFEKPDPFLKMMIKRSDTAWFYTKTELELWNKKMDNLKASALNNTISGIDRIFALPTPNVDDLKNKYQITQPFVILFCARFNIAARRTDLLEKAMWQFDNERFAFVIIGDGQLKPDFSTYGNVYDFGALYDAEIKDDLFQLADIYFQPGWLGLSIVEAMAYGLPIFSFKRSETILQCVEYGYLQNDVNGKIFNKFDDFVEEVNNLNSATLKELRKKTKEFASKNFLMSDMINNAIKSIEPIA